MELPCPHHADRQRQLLTSRIIPRPQYSRSPHPHLLEGGPLQLWLELEAHRGRTLRRHGSSRQNRSCFSEKQSFERRYRWSPLPRTKSDEYFPGLDGSETECLSLRLVHSSQD